MALRQTPRKLYWPKLYQFELYKRNSYNFNVNILFWNDKYSSRFSEEKFSRFMWIKKKKKKRKEKEKKIKKTFCLIKLYLFTRDVSP